VFKFSNSYAFAFLGVRLEQFLVGEDLDGPSIRRACMVLQQNAFLLLVNKLNVLVQHELHVLLLCRRALSVKQSMNLSQLICLLKAHLTLVRSVRRSSSGLLPVLGACFYLVYTQISGSADIVQLSTQGRVLVRPVVFFLEGNGLHVNLVKAPLLLHYICNLQWLSRTAFRVLSRASRFAFRLLRWFICLRLILFLSQHFG